jgi:hypothetical protein
MEQQHLRPLPAWVPEVYRLHERMVDVEGLRHGEHQPLLGTG